jgi:hypothetical protein
MTQDNEKNNNNNNIFNINNVNYNKNNNFYNINKNIFNLLIIILIINVLGPDAGPKRFESEPSAFGSPNLLGLVVQLNLKLFWVLPPTRPKSNGSVGGRTQHIIYT